MEAIWNYGNEIILYLQSLGDWLLIPMQFFTFLGNEEFYLFVAPAVVWCFDMRLGLSLGLRLMVSASINSTLKMVFKHPRPYWLDNRVIAHGAEASFGVPSGHSQNAVVVWGTLAAWIGRRWAWITAILIVFLIGLSRMYLGVHFPTDVLVGWAIGALLLWLFSRWEEPVFAWVRRHSVGNQILIVFGASLVLILFGALIGLLSQSWQLPGAWQQLAAQAYPEADLIAPLSLSGLISNAGVFFGLAAGAIILESQGGFDAKGPIWQRVLRFILGIIGVFAIWFGLGELFPRGEYFLAYLLRYLRYGLIGLWVTLAPILFIRLRLAEPEER